ncbi:23S rRNA (Uracil-5-) -methyltransferase rumB [Serinicoccus hydrothermalis]|uniref:23S rRNA (Uracil-5-) -methyltransferase rumB n=2 Tax=Serinicoccus hydrothermalis TaxID=1758689 RepID=A0A1B1N8L3_9MICO|nr:23S rRNA (Uracil-5-) -methyltransferase rumB [Serinicoccus hydrothermalis]
MGQPYALQLAQKQRDVAGTLDTHVAADPWLEPVPSPESGFRNKAKLVVGGTKVAPTVGILDADGHGTDLRHCGLYEAGLDRAVAALPDLLAGAGLTPYDVPSRQGELKHVLLTHSPDDAILARVVLRSPGQRRRVGDLVEAWRRRPDLPRLQVASINLQPAHAAVLEGRREEVLTPDTTLPMRLGEVTLHLGTRSFFQTNTTVASALYRQVAAWVDELDPGSVWDLYCGVGGFAVHLAAPGRQVTGVEVSAEAVRSAGRSAEGLGPAAEGLRFVTDDATAYALGSARQERPDLVIVNPPRRGLGARLPEWLETSGIPHVVYSSCAAATLSQDLERMPSYRVTRARLFDMFPQTRHHEVAVVLSRHAGGSLGPEAAALP